MPRVAVIANPVSGSGRARAVAEDLVCRLQAGGHDVEHVPTELSDPAGWLDPVLVEATTALVVGGDGTVRLAAESLVRSGTPVWQVPCGTENLLARSLGMSGDYESILAAIEHGEIRSLDVARVNGMICLLMASCGFDAAVVHDLSRRRGDSIRHWHYIPCIVRRLLKWKPTVMTLTLDDEIVREHESGWCFVCNCREYGGGFNPAPHAEMSDGLLDVVFLPTRSRIQVLSWMHRTRRGRHLEDPGVLHARARSIRVDISTDSFWQLDGDPPPHPLHGTASRLQIECLPDAVNALLPCSNGA